MAETRLEAIKARCEKLGWEFLLIKIAGIEDAFWIATKGHEHKLENNDAGLTAAERLLAAYEAQDSRRDEAVKEYDEYWEELLKTDGQWDAEKIRNEMSDLIFIYQQVAIVYDYITGGQLSKPMYYADVITTMHDDAITKAIDEALTEEGAQGGEGPVVVINPPITCAFFIERERPDKPGDQLIGDCQLLEIDKCTHGEKPCPGAGRFRLVRVGDVEEGDNNG